MNQPIQRRRTETTHNSCRASGRPLLLPAAFVLLAPVYIAWRALRNARTAMAMLAENTPVTTGLLVVAEFAVTAAMLGASLYMIHLLLRRRAFFREAYVTFMLGGVKLLMAFVGLATTLAVLGSEIDSPLYQLDLLDLRQGLPPR